MEMRDTTKSGDLPTAQQLSLYPNLEPLQASAPNTFDNLPEEERIWHLMPRPNEVR